MDNFNKSFYEKDHSKEIRLEESSKKEWLLVTLISSINLITAIWSTFTFFLYCIRLKKWSLSENRTNNYKAISATLALLTTLLTLPRLLTTILVNNISSFKLSRITEDHLCEVLLDLADVFYYIAILPPYTFFWFRQRMLYIQPSLKHFDSIMIRVVSFATLFLIYCGCGTACILFVYPKSYEFIGLGCVKRQEEVNNFSPNIISLCCIIQSQFFLNILLCYPLKAYWKSFKNRVHSTSVIGERLVHITKFTVLLSLLCSMSDILVLIISQSISSHLRLKTLSSTLYDINLLINMVCVLLTFQNKTGVFCSWFINRSVVLENTVNFNVVLNLVSLKKRDTNS